MVLGAGTILSLFSAFCFTAAVWREVFPGPPPPKPGAWRIPIALLHCVNAFLIFVSLVAMLGIWFGSMQLHL